MKDNENYKVFIISLYDLGILEVEERGGSQYHFGMGCDPPPSPLNGINDPFKRGGSHPKMKLEGEERLL